MFIIVLILIKYKINKTFRDDKENQLLKLYYNFWIKFILIF